MHRPRRTRRHPLHRAWLPLGLAAVLPLMGCEGDSLSPTAPSVPGPSLAKESTVSGNGYELVRLGGEESLAIELNRTGVVVGRVVRDYFRRAAYWTVDEAGTVTGPFELGIPATGTYFEGTALGVNDAGHVIAMDRASNRGFVYDLAADDLVQLSAPEGAVGVTPRSINAGSTVTGNAWFDVDGETVPRPVVWTDPFDPGVAPTLLPLPDGHAAYARCSLPVPFNDAGVIVGYSEADDGTCWLVRWELAADGTVGAPEILGSAESSFYRWMNEAERLAGFTRASSGLQAVVREPDGSLIELAPASGDDEAFAVGLDDPAAGDPLRVTGTSDPWLDDERAVVWSVASDGTPSAPVLLPLGEYDVSSRGSSVDAGGRVVGEVTYTDPHPRRSGGQVAALWLPLADGGGGDGGGDDGGDDCVPKGPHGNNCK